MNIKERYYLSGLIENAIDTMVFPKFYQEPDIVAKLVIELPDIIKKSLNTINPAKRYNVGGAFIHQKPIVRFVNRPGLPKPELGDLLIICHETRSFGDVYNAMFLQAKLSDRPFKQIIPKDHQFVLYSEWPEFEYQRAGSLNGKRRSILPKTITQGAQYLLINRDDNHADFFTATVDNPLNSSRCFPATLASIISFDDGRTFQMDNPRDDWSQMVIDTLNIVSSKKVVFNRRKAGFAGKKRLHGEFSLHFLLNNTVTPADVAQIKQQGQGNEPYGFGVICISISDE